MAPKGRGGARSKYVAAQRQHRPARRAGKVVKKRGWGPKFDSARVAAVEETDGDASEHDRSADEALQSEDEDEDSGSEAGVNDTKRSYAALMRSFAEDAEPVKRRKLDHPPRGERLETGADLDLELDEEWSEKDGDRVEEGEEGPEDAFPAEENDDYEDYDGDDEMLDTSDPFEIHFQNPDQAEVASRLKAIGVNEYRPLQCESNGWRVVTHLPAKSAVSSARPLPSLAGPSGLKLKQKLVEAAAQRSTFNSLEQVLYPITFGYNDLFFCARTSRNADELRRMACVHTINHVLKTRDKVIKNNAKLAKLAGEGDKADFEPRDQGFTRPKVLMLLPTRQSAVRMANTICALYQPEQQENKKRFDEEYVDKDQKYIVDRPEDFRELFEGNDDDMFRLGMKLTRKTIKYFSQFYSSDILMASPLGLKMAIGCEEEKDKKKRLEYDFLSSIEVVIIDQADALLMQNWEHVEFILEHLNLQPRDAHGCDFSRVREWYLDKKARNFRQTIVFSAFNTPELAELHRQCQNWAGKIRVQPEYPGSIQELGVQVKQTFSRFESPSIGDEPDARFAYFTSAIVPNLVKRARENSGTLILVPSYLDFVRVRNYFATSAAVASLTFGTVSEYASVPEASRARSYFLNGRHKVLLYTERAHHFRRYVLAGVQRVIMYGLPDNPLFYKEIAGGYLSKSEQDLKLEPGQGTVRVLFCKYDLLKLERIVGSQRVGKMVRERGDTFDFV